jgi:integrase
MTKTIYPKGVENHGGFLRIHFQYQGVRVREALGIPDTAKNRKVAGEMRANVVYEVKTGAFVYQRTFPTSVHLSKFGDTREELTVKQMAERWLAVKETEISRNTLASYKTRLTTCLGILGESKFIRGLKTEDIQKMRLMLLKGSYVFGRNRNMTGSGRSVAYVNTCMSDIYSLFKFAHENGYADRNIVSSLSPLKKDKPKPDPLTRDEFHRFSASCNSRQIRNLWSLAVYTGLRHGELCALAWEDIDLQAGLITVRRNLTVLGDFTPPKTNAGERKVYLIRAAAEILRDQMELTRMHPAREVTILSREYGRSEQEELTFVFNPKVNAINFKSDSYYTVSSLPQTWRAAVKKAGIKYRKPYQSRHTYACWSLSAGANPNFIASQMGHANAQMVYQVYGSWMSENDEAQMSLLNEKLNDFVPSLSHSKAV